MTKEDLQKLVADWVFESQHFVCDYPIADYVVLSDEIPELVDLIWEKL